MTANSTPSLATSRLRLRPFTLDDVDPLFRIMSQPNIMQYFPTPAAPDYARVERLVERQIEHWQTHNHGWWAVTWPEQDQLIGWCGLQYLPETDEVEVGYLLDRAYWGQGLATEAASASVDFGLRVHKLSVIIGLTHPDNLASQRVLQKAGLAFTGEAVYFNMLCKRYSISAPGNT